MSETLKHSYLNDETDEIDIVDLIKQIWNSRIKIAVSTLIITFFVLIYSLLTPPTFRSHTSFFLNDDVSSQVSGYSSLLGLNSSSSISSVIENVLNSKTLKLKVARYYHEHFAEDIKVAIQDESLTEDPYYIDNFVLRLLDFKNNLSILVTKSDLYELYYVSESPEFAKSILETILKELLSYSEALDLSAKKNLITVIDPPNLPLVKYAPDIFRNIVFASISALFLSCFVSVVFPVMRDIFKQI